MLDPARSDNSWMALFGPSPTHLTTRPAISPMTHQDRLTTLTVLLGQRSLEFCRAHRSTKEADALCRLAPFGETTEEFACALQGRLGTELQRRRDI